MYSILKHKALWDVNECMQREGYDNEWACPHTDGQMIGQKESGPPDRRFLLIFAIFEQCVNVKSHL